MSLVMAEPATLSLAAALLLAAYLTDRAWTPPNPQPAGTAASLPRDSVAASMNAKTLQLRRFIPLSLWILHTFVTLWRAAGGGGSSSQTPVCPNAHNVSSSLFIWSPRTALPLLTIFIAAPLRLLAFAYLGESFTFRLARPKRLVTTGPLYSRVRHPSYPANWLITTATLALLLRLDGVLGCVLPTAVVAWAGLPWDALTVVMAVMGLGVMWVRVREEEELLRDEFGSEWVDYATRTKRFIPGVF